MKDKSIPDGNIRASSQYSQSFHVKYARLDHSSSWSAATTDDEPWIQADIGYETKVSGLVTQGDGGSGKYDDWVITLKVSIYDDVTRNSDGPGIFVGDDGNGHKVCISYIISFKVV